MRQMRLQICLELRFENPNESDAIPGNDTHSDIHREDAKNETVLPQRGPHDANGGAPRPVVIGWKRSLLNFLILILMRLLSQIFLMRLNLSSWHCNRERYRTYIMNGIRLPPLVPPSGERMTSVETWFIDPTRFPHCAQPRIAALHPEVQFWKREFRRLWADHMDPTV